jgi:hypothetical protein
MLSPVIEDQLIALVLAALGGAAAWGMPRELLLREARGQVWRELTDVDLGATLRLLADRGLVIEVPALVGPSRWRLTDLGRSVAREKGLA